MRLVRPLVASVVIAITACSEHPQTPTAPRASLASAPEASILEQEGYMLTPAGWFHESCVHGIPSGARQVGTLVTLPSGASYRIPKCQFPAHPNVFDRANSRNDFPEDTGWDEYAYDTIYTPYRHIASSWKVPPGPVPGNYSAGQIYYTFPGLQNFADTAYILQPVLQWGKSPAGGGDYWSAASWHCDDGTGTCTHSTPLLPVSVGDSLYGTVDASSCTSGTCTWTATVQDASKGTSSTRSWIDADNYLWALGGVIETHGGFNSCAGFPVQPMVFTGITLSDANGPVTPGWGQYVRPPSPDCGFNVVIVSSSEVGLVEHVLATSVSAAPSPAPPYSDVTAYANATGGLPPFAVSWFVNGVQACGHAWSCTAQIGAQGTTTTFTADVTDAQPESADDSVSVYAGCTPPPCHYKPVGTASVRGSGPG